MYIKLTPLKLILLVTGILTTYVFLPNSCGSASNVWNILSQHGGRDVFSDLYRRYHGDEGPKSSHPQCWGMTTISPLRITCMTMCLLSPCELVYWVRLYLAFSACPTELVRCSACCSASLASRALGTFGCYSLYTEKSRMPLNLFCGLVGSACCLVGSACYPVFKSTWNIFCIVSYAGSATILLLLLQPIHMSLIFRYEWWFQPAQALMFNITVVLCLMQVWINNPTKGFT